MNGAYPSRSQILLTITLTPILRGFWKISMWSRVRQEAEGNKLAQIFDSEF